MNAKSIVALYLKSLRSIALLGKQTVTAEFILGLGFSLVGARSKLALSFTERTGPGRVYRKRGVIVVFGDEKSRGWAKVVRVYRDIGVCGATEWDPNLVNAAHRVDDMTGFLRALKEAESYGDEHDGGWFVTLTDPKPARFTRNQVMMCEMVAVIKPSDGNIIARHEKTNRPGLILKKKRVGGGFLYTGRAVLGDFDCLFRRTQLRGVKLGGRWSARDPFPVGYVEPSDVARLLKGEKDVRN